MDMTQVIVAFRNFANASGNMRVMKDPFPLYRQKERKKKIYERNG
jgi:hypothetical protein